MSATISIVYLGTTFWLRATITETSTAGVTSLSSGATVVVTIRNRAGIALVTDASLAEIGSTGVYSYTGASTLLPNNGQKYEGAIVATKAGNTATHYETILVEKHVA